MVAPRKSFDLGKLCATPGALKALQDAGETALAYLARHGRGDWGEINQEDWELNDRALEEGLRLLSAYRLKSGTRIWIITEADRSATTVLLPENY